MNIEEDKDFNEILPFLIHYRTLLNKQKDMYKERGNMAFYRTAVGKTRVLSRLIGRLKELS